MRLIFRRVICIAVLCTCWQFARAQAYRQLTVNDFAGVPHRNSGVIAYTNCSIEYKYEAYRKTGYYQLYFNIKLTVNRDRSWMDKSSITSPEMLAEVLKHEQGHYIIAYLEQQELLREVGKTVFGSDYQYRAQEIFDRIDAKYKQLNQDYDEDTGHMANRVQQISWDKYFQKKLEYMPPSDEG
ncbi:MAG TPA: hypothetical protein VK671_15820 [Mucilaginibacter sp.]|jgi:hypothetical protein|nr:hypothetical protein [Mucilaginibacter sp.]